MTQPKQTLGGLSVGAQGIVRRVGCARPVARRLMEMGLLPGTPVEVLRVAPLGDPIVVQVRGYSLSVRRRDAAEVLLSDVSAKAKVPSALQEGAA